MEAEVARCIVKISVCRISAEARGVCCARESVWYGGVREETQTSRSTQNQLIIITTRVFRLSTPTYKEGVMEEIMLCKHATI